MKRLLTFAGIACALALSTVVPARADVYVDSPSFGRIVYGITGGQVVLPSDAWTGYYADGTSVVAAPDSSFTGAASSVYVGDSTSGLVAYWDGTKLTTTGSDTLAVNGAQYGDTGGACNNAWSITTGADMDLVWSAKLAYVARYGVTGSVSLRDTGTNVLTTLFTSADALGATNTVTTGDPFAIHYTALSGLLVSDSANLSLNSGTTTHNRVKAYVVSDTTSAYYGYMFVGIEDWNDETKRWDWNDTVIMLTVEAVPEPAFFQMAGLLSMGAFGLLRLRRRSA